MWAGQKKMQRGSGRGIAVDTSRVVRYTSRSAIGRVCYGRFHYSHVPSFPFVLLWRIILYYICESIHMCPHFFYNICIEEIDGIQILLANQIIYGNENQLSCRMSNVGQSVSSFVLLRMG